MVLLGQKISGQSPVDLPHNPMSESIFVARDIAKQKTIFEKVVCRCSDHLPFSSRVQKISTICLAIIVNIISFGVLLPVTLRIQAILHKHKVEEAASKFYREIEERIKKEEVTLPPKGMIALKSDMRAFNHVNEYAIESGILWYRRRGSVDWTPLFFDGCMTGVTPVRLSVDGANMVIMDSAGKMHYRKVLVEKRGMQEIQQRSVVERTSAEDRKGVLPSEEVYFAIDKTEKLRCKHKWFSLPFVSRIVNALLGPTPIPMNCLISHRAKFSQGFQDAIGLLHTPSVGVTSLYELESGGHTIRLRDPWVPHWAKMSVVLPETEDTLYIAEKIDVSASTIASIGYTFNENTGEGRLKLLTRFFDADSGGCNPCVPYSYRASSEVPVHNREWYRRLIPKKIKQSIPEIAEDLILPDEVENEGWQEHTLPEECSELYSQISILQTGQVAGEGRYELRIAGKNIGGELGYFYKDLHEREWKFEKNEQVDTSVRLERCRQRSVPTGLRKTHCYENVSTKENQVSISLLNFGKDASCHPTVQLQVGSSTERFSLHRRLGWGIFFGKRDEVYDLVFPKDRIKDDNVFFHAFGSRRAVPIKIETKSQNGEEEVVLHIEGRSPPEILPLKRKVRDL